MMDVKSNTFIGVQYDQEFAKVAHAIVKGLIVNAQAFAQLIAVIKASNVHIDTLVKIECNKDSEDDLAQTCQES